MTSFLSFLSQELTNMKAELQKLGQDPVKPEKATIIEKRQNNSSYYYMGEKGRRKRTYLGGADSPKLKSVLVSAYKEALMEDLRKDISLLECFLDSFVPYDKAHVITQLPRCVHDMDFSNTGNMIMKDLFAWAHAPYKKNPREFPKAAIFAKDGTRVRSKSECIIYNALLDAGIPFRYDPLMEFRITDSNNKIVTITKSPDFQIICPDGSFILIEHAGGLKYDSYAVDLASKIQIYLLNGYIIGRSLFITADDMNGGIDSAEIQKVIELISMRFPMV